VSDQFPGLETEHSRFIEAQHIFFVGTAAPDGRVNLSPQGQDSLRILSPNEILWMNLTGSGNETAAHLLESDRITLMWCAFAGSPKILRAYGAAQVFHARDSRYAEFARVLPARLGTRQYVLVNIDLVQTSCGYAVPFMEYSEDRSALSKWADKKGVAGVEEYWRQRNQRSLDDKPTGILNQDTR
jgi:hypothetical protein